MFSQIKTNVKCKSNLGLFWKMFFSKFSLAVLVCCMFLTGCGPTNLYDLDRKTMDQKYPSGSIRDKIVELCNSRLLDEKDPSGLLNKKGPIKIDQEINHDDPIWHHVSHGYFKKCVREIEAMGLPKPSTLDVYREYARILDGTTYYDFLYYNDHYLFYDDSYKLICAFRCPK